MLVAVAGAAVFALAEIGCSSAKPGVRECGNGRGGERIDEVAGAFRTVRLGEPGAVAQHRLPGAMRSRSGSGPLIGCGQTFLGGVNLGTTHYFLRTADLGVYVSDRRVSALEVITSGARTLRGVAVGDELSAARAAYRERQPQCQGESGVDQYLYPSCRIHVTRSRWLYFGGDPITEIAVTSFAL